ncbi:tropomyosin-like [Argopecten irradians]|uniref:tropomyosin-like n=1 Tax=Argopecten irradians TaxID=31199 RepID=UPI00371D472C
MAQMQTEIRCPNHPTVDVLFVCLEDGCKEALACPRCIIESGAHFRHKLAILDDHLGTFKEKILDYSSQTRTGILVPLQSSAKRVFDDLKRLDPATTMLMSNIEEREEKIISHTKMLVVELKKQCKDTQDTNRQKFEQYQERLMARITEVETDIAALESCLAENRKADIANAATTRLTKTYDSVEYPVDIQEITFNESDKSFNEIEALLGTLQIGSEQRGRGETEGEKIKRFEREIEDLTQIGESSQNRIRELEKEMKDRETADAEQIKGLEIDNSQLKQSGESFQNRIRELEKELKQFEDREKADAQKIKLLETETSQLKQKEKSDAGKITQLEAENNQLKQKTRVLGTKVQMPQAEARVSARSVVKTPELGTP